jgi:hypothetical protein
MKEKTITLFKENKVRFVATRQESLILKAKRIVHDEYIKAGYLSYPLPSRMFPEEKAIKGTYLLALNKNEIIGILRVSPVKNPLQFFREWKIKISVKTKKKLEGLKKLGWHVEKIAPPLFYLGSLTVPAILPLKKQIGSVFKKNSNYFSYLIGEKEIKI